MTEVECGFHPARVGRSPVANSAGNEHLMPDKTILMAILKDQYRTKVATSGAALVQVRGVARLSGRP